MPFQIPENLDQFSAAGLNDFRNIAEEEFTTLQAAIKSGDREPEKVERAKTLLAFIGEVDAKLDTFETAEAEATDVINASVTRPVKEVAKAAETATETATETAETATETVTASATTGNAAATTTTVTVTDIAPAKVAAEVAKPAKNYTIIAAAETGVAAGSELADMKALTAAFMERTRTYGRGSDAMQHPVAQIKRHFPENRFYTPGMGEEAVWKMGQDATNEKLLPGGSLLKAVTAGVGWCAPSETIYSTCSQITATGLIDLPTIGARRGGIRHNQGIEFSAIFGGGTGFNILTEAQVIADTVKTCVQIPCPSFVDDRLKVAALCLTGDLLQNVGYPEFVQTFMEGAIAAQAHNVARDIISIMVAGSTAVDLTAPAGLDPWASDGSVLSQVMSAAELAVVDIRYRLRLDPAATIEMIFPYWLPAQMRADWIRRNGPVDPDLLDAKIASMFATRGVRPQYVYNWQDAFSGLTTTGPGAATPLKLLPSSLQFLAYPAGTWMLAQQDVIRLDSVYDSTLLATNKVTQLFVEDGYLPMRMCPLSRVYTVGICPTGATGAQRNVDCVTP